MQAIKMYRDWAIDQLGKTINTLGYIVETTSQQDASAYRDGGDGWTALEVVGHLRDYEEVFIERTRLTLNEDNPALPMPDQEALAVERAYNSGDLRQTYKEWAALRREFIPMLEGVDESGWERPAVHPRRGPFTLTDQLMLIEWHDLNHIEQIAKILLERKGG